MMCPDCSPPTLQPLCAHLLEHVAVADLRAQQLQPRIAKLPLQAQVGHDGRHDRITLELAARLQPQSDQRHQLVAVDQLPLLVDNDQAVRVTVERQADIRAARDNRFLHQPRMGRAAVVVDVETVGRDAERDHLGAELPQRVGRDMIGGAVCAIDDHLEAVEPKMLGKRILGELDIAAARIVDPPSPADHAPTSRASALSRGAARSRARLRR